MKLHLHVKAEYFLAIKSGEKRTENRLVNEYWMKRLIGREYDGALARKSWAVMGNFKWGWTG